MDIAIGAAGAERVALVTVRLDLGGVLVEKSETIAILVAGEDLVCVRYLNIQL